MPSNAVVDQTAPNEESPTPIKLSSTTVGSERDGSPAARGRSESASPAIKKVELDEFGLPVRKFKKPVLEDDSEEETDYRRTWKYVRKRGESRSTSRDMLGSTAPIGHTPERKATPLATDTPLSASSRNSIYLEAPETVEPEVKQENVTVAPALVQPEVKKDEAKDLPESTKPESKNEDNKDGRKSTEEVEKKDNKDAPADQVTTVPVINGQIDERPLAERLLFPRSPDLDNPAGFASEWSHQQVVPQKHKENRDSKTEEEWQTMPAFAPYDIYDDDNKLVAREAIESDDEAAYDGLGGAGKGYTRVNVDEDAQSATSMDENTKYLFKEPGTNVVDEDEEERNPLSQMQATKDLLTEGQRIAYVGVCRLAMVAMLKEVEDLKTTKGTKKEIGFAVEGMKMWSQKMMVRLYTHMDISPEEQIMIEQLAEHGVEPGDLTPTLMHNSRVNNPMAQESPSKPSSLASPNPEAAVSKSPRASPMPQDEDGFGAQSPPPPPPYEEHEGDELPQVKTPSQLPGTKKIDIDLRWTVLCDLFLVLIADSVYDSRSRVLLERVGGFLNISWLEICKFEKRVTDALEMQEAAAKENWNEEEHMESRRKRAVKRKMIVMGLATVGGGLVIGLSAGLLAPLIGAGLAAGFTTIGVAGTSGFLAGAGGAALITSVAATSGGVIAVRASARRMGSVKTFEYRPLHNNKRVNLIVTISGWMNGKIDDVRLPYSTVDPIMGDIYSVLWEPEMLQSMGDTINILATEALTQGLQQVLGSTILVALMSAIQLPIVLTKLSYLIDNPWTVSLDRANSAGLILADSLIDRNLGARPVTLVGYSLGSRVIFSCLRELASKGATGIVQNVYLFGAPIVAKKEEFLRARTVISGRFVNGYATNDWILGYLFRATSGGIMRVAGLAPVEDIPGLENIDVTKLVEGHMAYRAAMPRLLREVGWAVDSDEFAEIEDPDPENHKARQRELINEIEEARKELEKEPKKKKFSFFGRNKKLAEKKDWETYDDNTKEGNFEESRKTSGVFFDIEAIRAELANQEMEVKEIKSTLPPMKLDLNAPYATGQLHTPYSNLRPSKSYDGNLPSQSSNVAATSLPSLGKGLEKGESKKSHYLDYEEYDYSPTHDGEEGMRMDFEEPRRSLSPAASGLRATPLNDSPPVRTSSSFARPELKSSVTMPASLSRAVEHNAWLDDEDYELGGEKEVTMSFE